MRKVFFELKVIDPIFFEVTSESEVPDWFVERVIRSVYQTGLCEENGNIVCNLGQRSIDLNYFIKGKLAHIFIPMTKEINWNRILCSFSSFCSESRVIPYNIEIEVREKTDDPEMVFDKLSKKIKGILSRTVGQDSEPDISYEGDIFKIKISLPLDKEALQKINDLVASEDWSLSSEIAPLEEKIKV